MSSIANRFLRCGVRTLCFQMKDLNRIKHANLLVFEKRESKSVLSLSFRPPSFVCTLYVCVYMRAFAPGRVLPASENLAKQFPPHTTAALLDKNRPKVAPLSLFFLDRSSHNNFCIRR